MGRSGTGRRGADLLRDLLLNISRRDDEVCLKFIPLWFRYDVCTYASYTVPGMRGYQKSDGIEGISEDEALAPHCLLCQHSV
jgi:hypothetical protein